ncbi:9767_t:CDS:10 [Ambispora gerdemannii]|uniref:9767_t:CDS:1 n=1 Tax=Ambispora gerdemannii TaxID=144530 RepID=A0A9N9ALA1_9GLOM|nr:9767_t:CDS:10 [Ambispora gerdemannii]
MSLSSKRKRAGNTTNSSKQAPPIHTDKEFTQNATTTSVNYEDDINDFSIASSNSFHTDDELPISSKRSKNEPNTPEEEEASINSSSNSSVSDGSGASATIIDTKNFPHSPPLLSPSQYTYTVNPPPVGRPIRIYCDGIFDLFHFGHARMLEQAKKAFGDEREVYLLVGVCDDQLTREKKGKTVMNGYERAESLRHCKWVDCVIEHAPWVVDQEFLSKHRIDYVAHDDIPYASIDTSDVYAFVKEQGKFLPTHRTEGVSTSDLITRIVRDYDQYVRRNLERGVTAKELNLGFLKEQEVNLKKSISDIKTSIHQNWHGTKTELRNDFSELKNDLRQTFAVWEEKSQEYVREFSRKFGAESVVDKIFRRRSRRSMVGGVANGEDSTSTITGVPPDHLRVLATLMSTYPLALTFRSLPPRNQNLKHLFSLTFAILVMFGMFDVANTTSLSRFATGVYGFLVCALLCYAVTVYVKGKWAPRIVFFLAMGHLSVSARLSNDKFDLTGPQMILVIKLTTFAFSVYDGQKPIKELTPYQRNKRIVVLPSLLEFLGYVFFFGGFLVGPAFEFMDYRQFITMGMYKLSSKTLKRIQLQHHDEIDQSLQNNIIGQNNGQITDNQKDDDDDDEKKNLYYIPDGFYPAVRKLLFGFFWITLSMLMAKEFTIEWTLSEEYKKKSFLYKFYYIQIAAFCARFKYYVVWLIAEGACILSGLGFNGYDDKGNAKWNRVTNIDVIAYETADNIKTLLEAWNMNTNIWLKNYVYLRVTPSGKKPTFFSTFATFGTSALWHGFLPGYYLTFVSGAFVQSTHRAIRRNIRPFFLTPTLSPYKRIYDLTGWFATQITINYLIVPFLLLSLRQSLHVWKLNYFIAHVGVILINVLFAMGAGKMLMRTRVLLSNKKDLLKQVEKSTNGDAKDIGENIENAVVPE